MKKFVKIMCCVFACLFCFSLVGCAIDDNTNNSNNGSTNYKVFDLTLIVSGETWMEVKCNDINKLPSPSREYCDFDGWYLNGEKVENLDLDVLEAKFSLEAKFTLQTKYKCVEMLTAAMGETIKSGEYVLIDTTLTNYAIKDIVVYKKYNNLLISRIVEINGESIGIKGDSNNVGNETIAKSDIVGKVVYIIGDTLPRDVIG